MDIDGIVPIVACGVIAVCAVGFVGGTLRIVRSETARERAVDVIARRARLAVPDGMRVAVTARVVELRKRGAATAVALAIVVVIAILAATALPGPARIWLADGIAGLCLPAVQLWSARRGLQRIPDGAPRFARARAVTLEDYLDPLTLVLLRVTAPLAFAGAILLLVTGQAGSESGLATTAIVAGIAALPAAVAFELSARALVRSPQPAGDPTALAWDDAFRSSALQSTLGLPCLLSTYSLMTMLSAESVAHHGWLALVSLGFVVVVAVLGVVSLARSPHRRYLRRLWPEIAAQSGVSAAPAVGDAAPTAGTAAG